MHMFTQTLSCSITTGKCLFKEGPGPTALQLEQGSWMLHEVLYTIVCQAH